MLSTRPVSTAHVLDPLECLALYNTNRKSYECSVHTIHKLGPCWWTVLMARVDQATVTQCYFGQLENMSSMLQPSAGKRWQQQLWTSSDEISVSPDA